MDGQIVRHREPSSKTEFWKMTPGEVLLSEPGTPNTMSVSEQKYGRGPRKSQRRLAAAPRPHRVRRLLAWRAGRRGTRFEVVEAVEALPARFRGPADIHRTAGARGNESPEKVPIQSGFCVVWPVGSTTPAEGPQRRSDRSERSHQHSGDGRRLIAAPIAAFAPELYDNEHRRKPDGGQNVQNRRSH